MIFYVSASKAVDYLIPEQIKELSGNPIRILITAGTIQNLELRMSLLESFDPNSKVIVQINQDRNYGVGPKLFYQQWQPMIQWHSIPALGTVWEIQEALAETEERREWLIIPLVPEQALKISLVIGDTSRVRVIPLPASPSRRGIEFIKSYLGWHFPDFVRKFRQHYYRYDSGNVL